MRPPSVYQKGVMFVGGLVVGAAATIVGAFTAQTGTFTTSVTTPQLAVGSTGSQVTLIKSAAASLTFGAIKGGQCVGQAITVTGASTSTSMTQSVAIGVPQSVVASATATSWFGYASAPDTVTVVGCNGSQLQQPTLPAATFRATVTQFN